MAARLRTDDGFTIVEILVAATILVTGILGMMAALDVFRASSSLSVAREAATHEAQSELEQLRGVGYRRLVLASSPGTAAAAQDPRSGVTGTDYKPAADQTAAPLVINPAAEGALAPSRSWSAGGTSGTVYRFITQRPAGAAACGQVCPKRVSVGVTYTVAGKLHSVVLSTLVADPQDGLADEISAQPTKPATCPCWSTFYLYDTPAMFADRQTPTTDHLLHRRDDYPDLMGSDPPPNPFENATTAPFEPPRYRYGTDLELSAGLGETYPGGALIKESGGCNDDGAKEKSARWTTRPVLQNTTLHGAATAQVFTKLAGALTGLGRMCFTFYDWVIEADGKIKGGPGNKVKLLSFDYLQPAWPTGTPEMISSGLKRYLNVGATRTLLAGRSLGVEITFDDDSVGTAAVFYDHPELASFIQVESTPAI